MTTLRSLPARLLARFRPAARKPLEPADAYRLWAPTYGREPNAFQRLEAPLVTRLLAPLRSAEVLDLGCGRGRIAQLAIAGGARRVVAADLVLAMHAAGGAASGVPPLRLVAATHPLPFPRATFDLVICALVLGHQRDLTGALAAVARVLRPGGRLVVSDFHPEAAARGWQRTFERDGESRAIVQHPHTEADYRAACHAAGLVIGRSLKARWRGQPVVLAFEAAKAG